MNHSVHTKELLGRKKPRSERGYFLSFNTTSFEQRGEVMLWHGAEAVVFVFVI
jgi:hypothetical protein